MTEAQRKKLLILADPDSPRHNLHDNDSAAVRAALAEIDRLATNNRTLASDVNVVGARAIQAERELVTAKQEHARLLQYATEAKLKLDDRTMAHRNEAAALRTELATCRDCLETARHAVERERAKAQPPQPTAIVWVGASDFEGYEAHADALARVRAHDDNEVGVTLYAVKNWTWHPKQEGI